MSTEYPESHVGYGTNPRPEVPRLKYLLVEEFARAIDVTASVAKRWIKQGKVRAMKFGKYYRIPVAELERIIQEFEGTASSTETTAVPNNNEPR